MGIVVNISMDIVILTSGPKLTNTRVLKDSLEEISRNYFVYRSIGAYKIADVCRKEHLSVKVIDHIVHFSKDELIEVLKLYVDKQTKILAISTTFLVTRNVLDENIIDSISIIANEFPNLKIIMGGHNSYVAKRITDFDTYAIITEYAEDIFRDVVNFICKNGNEPKFMIDTNIKSNKLIKIYNDSIFKFYQIENDNFRFHPDDVIITGESLPLEISRGCIFKCKFCSYSMLGRGKLDYLRKFELIKDELIYNYENWNTTSYYIICDTFNDTEYKMIEWNKMLTSLPFKIKYTAYLRADLLDKFKDVPYMLEESGLVSAFHGIESLNKKASLSVGKAWSGKKARDYIPKLYHDIWNKKVLQTLGFIVGLPNDTKEDILSTIDWINDNQLPHALFQPLYISNDTRQRSNLSEFEKNVTKYGYSFENRTLENSKIPIWKNEYWNLEEILDFIRYSIYPRLKTRTFGSWELIHYLGLGISLDELYDKKSFIGNLHVNNYLRKYKKLILKK